MPAIFSQQFRRRPSAVPASAVPDSRRESAASFKAAADRKLSSTPVSTRREQKFLFGKAAIVIVMAISVVLAGIIAIGLGVGLLRHQSSGTQAEVFWRPVNGTTWQIDLESDLTDTSVNAEVYDIDLYTNSPTTITNLHNLGHKVVCYFSAGSYEDFRPDYMLFRSSDYGNPIQDLHGEWWLDTRSSNVRAIMTTRLDLAAAKGCDGVDPDHTDGYGSNSGFPLTYDTAIDYVKFLATEAHARNLSIGLKNSAPLVKETLGLMQWHVNEQCELYNECAISHAFIGAGKPVFHIVYPTDAPEISAATKSYFCDAPYTKGFSTVFKERTLNDWRQVC